MAKFKVYTKRPDIKTVDLTVHGCDLTYSLLRPTTTQHIQLTHTMYAMQLSVQLDKTQGLVDARSYADCAVSILEFVSDVEGLSDEDGNDLAYADMTKDQREAFIFSVPVGHVAELINALVEIHAFGDVKKKSLGHTSSTSTSTDHAAAPAADKA